MPNISPSTAAVAELNQRYGTQLSGKDEVIKWPYYDSAAYPMAGSTRLQYFQAVTTNLDNSNVEQAAAFPAPKKFFLRGLGTFLVGAAFPSTTEAVAGTGLSARVNDNHEVMTSGRLALLIGNKQYLFAAPLGIIPSPVMFNEYADQFYHYDGVDNCRCYLCGYPAVCLYAGADDPPGAIIYSGGRVPLITYAATTDKALLIAGGI